MSALDAIRLTQELIRFDTVNPPGRERECAHYLGRILEDAGFHTGCYEFAAGRTTLIADVQGAGGGAPLVLTGHLDTVPFGHQPWAVEPLAGEISSGRLYGRGASDMKSGVAAAVAGAIEAVSGGRRPQRGIALILTAGEETGCDGSRYVAGLEGVLKTASALLVAEPTSNYPAVGHRGALWMKGTASGVTAHGSMPERGVNAVYKAARAIAKLEDFGFNQKPDPLLGSPSINVGTVSGGMNVNSVPDHAEFTIDVRSISRDSHAQTLKQLDSYLGDEVELDVFVDLHPVKTAVDDPFVQCAFEVMGAALDETIRPRTLPFFTDASILASALRAPAVIVGPGETALAHQTDEYCFVDRIPEAVSAYVEIMRRWCS